MHRAFCWFSKAVKICGNFSITAPATSAVRDLTYMMFVLDGGLGEGRHRAGTRGAKPAENSSGRHLSMVHPLDEPFPSLAIESNLIFLLPACFARESENSDYAAVSRPTRITSSASSKVPRSHDESLLQLLWKDRCVSTQPRRVETKSACTASSEIIVASIHPSRGARRRLSCPVDPNPT